MMRATANVALLMLAASYPLLLAVLAVGVWRTTTMDPPELASPEPDPPHEPIDDELRQLVAEADRDALLNAVRCDCPDCTLRREARRGRRTP